MRRAVAIAAAASAAHAGGHSAIPNWVEGVGAWCVQGAAADGDRFRALAFPVCEGFIAVDAPPPPPPPPTHEPEPPTCDEMVDRGDPYSYAAAGVILMAAMEKAGHVQLDSSERDEVERYLQEYTDTAVRLAKEVADGCYHVLTERELEAWNAVPHMLGEFRDMVR